MSAWFPPPEEAKALAEAVEILRRCEWGCIDHVETDIDVEESVTCPVCHEERPEHLPGCALDAFLKRWGNGRP